jgi:hypothetical protein
MGQPRFVANRRRPHRPIGALLQIDPFVGQGAAERASTSAIALATSVRRPSFEALGPYPRFEIGDELSPPAGGYALAAHFSLIAHRSRTGRPRSAPPPSPASSPSPNGSPGSWESAILSKNTTWAASSMAATKQGSRGRPRLQLRQPALLALLLSRIPLALGAAQNSMLTAPSARSAFFTVNHSMR